MLRLIRVALLVAMTFLVLSLVGGIARPETGPVEKLVLLAAVIGLLGLAVIQRIGTPTNSRRS